MDTTNTSLIFIGIDTMYVISNYHWTHWKCDRVICLTLCYLKRYLIWGFIFVRSFIIENYFIPYFELMVYYYSILTSIIFINLCLVLMTY